jgi:type I restriction enzyme S subunit
MRLRVGSGLPNIQKGDINNFKLLFPKKEEQQKIANFLSSIDKSIEKVDSQIEQSQKWKQGLLQKMFV